MKPSPVLVSLDTNEAARPRAQKIESVVEADARFLLCRVAELPFDMRFQWEGKTLDVELKDFTGDHQSDYVNSIIDAEGHLYQQSLAARELQNPLIITVLGGDAEVAQAIAKAVFSRGFRGQDAADKIIEYTHMVEGFEANCEGCNIRVWRLKENPYKRMLLRVRKILQGGDLTGFKPSPAEEERQAVGLSLLIGNGIGPVKAEAILEKFRISLEPLQTAETYLNDCPGIGPKLAEVVGKALNVQPGMILRPKVRKSVRKAKAKECLA